MSQWLDYVKWGSGASGAPATSGTINTFATCTGTSGTTTLTTTLSAALGDLILIHQSQGTGVGQWEVNYVISDNGSTLTLAQNLAFSYVSGAQCTLIPQYTGGTISGAITTTSWNGSTGGIIALASKGDLIITGSLKVEGVIGSSGTNSTVGPTSGGGFRGGRVINRSPSGTIGSQGEGTSGLGSEVTNGVANANGGGAGVPASGFERTPGAGGGGGVAGSNVAGIGDSPLTAIGGATSGQTSLVTATFGGGGGGGSTTNNGEQVGCGGSGGGIIFIIARTLTTSSGSMSVNGGQGGPSSGDYRAGGGGAGGSILIKCQTATIGTNTITATGGAAGASTGGGNGTAGGNGRIHFDYYASISGTSNPTLDSTQDTSLKSMSFGGMI